MGNRHISESTTKRMKKYEASIFALRAVGGFLHQLRVLHGEEPYKPSNHEGHEEQRDTIKGHLSPVRQATHCVAAHSRHQDRKEDRQHLRVKRPQQQPQ